jgi:hypothetical protein
MKIEQSLIDSLDETTLLWVSLFALNIYLDDTPKMKRFIYLSSALIAGKTVINYMKPEEDHKKEVYDYTYY